MGPFWAWRKGLTRPAWSGRDPREMVSPGNDECRVWGRVGTFRQAQKGPNQGPVLLNYLKVYISRAPAKIQRDPESFPPIQTSLGGEIKREELGWRRLGEEDKEGRLQDPLDSTSSFKLDHALFYLSLFYPFLCNAWVEFVVFRVCMMKFETLHWCIHDLIFELSTCVSCLWLNWNCLI